MSDIEVFEAFLEGTGATVWKDFEWQIVIGPWNGGVNKAFPSWDSLIAFMRKACTFDAGYLIDVKLEVPNEA